MSVYMLTRKIEFFRNMRYTTLFKNYYYSSVKPGINKIENVDYWKTQYSSSKYTYLKKYIHENSRFVRLEIIYSDVRELNYLRLILK